MSKSSIEEAVARIAAENEDTVALLKLARETLEKCLKDRNDYKAIAERGVQLCEQYRHARQMTFAHIRTALEVEIKKHASNPDVQLAFERALEIVKEKHR